MKKFIFMILVVSKLAAEPEQDYTTHPNRWKGISMLVSDQPQPAVHVQAKVLKVRRFWPDPIEHVDYVIEPLQLDSGMQAIDNVWTFFSKQVNNPALSRVWNNLMANRIVPNIVFSDLSNKDNFISLSEGGFSFNRTSAFTLKTSRGELNYGYLGDGKTIVLDSRFDYSALNTRQILELFNQTQNALTRHIHKQFPIIPFEQSTQILSAPEREFIIPKIFTSNHQNDLPLDAAEIDQFWVRNKTTGELNVQMISKISGVCTHGTLKKAWSVFSLQSAANIITNLTLICEGPLGERFGREVQIHTDPKKQTHKVVELTDADFVKLSPNEQLFQEISSMGRMFIGNESTRQVDRIFDSTFHPKEKDFLRTFHTNFTEFMSRVRWIENPPAEFFVIQGVEKAAKTLAGSRGEVFLNGRLLNQRSLSAGELFQLLIHEMAHQAGFVNEREVDQLASKIRKLFNIDNMRSAAPKYRKFSVEVPQSAEAFDFEFVGTDLKFVHHLRQGKLLKSYENFKVDWGQGGMTAPEVRIIPSGVSHGSDHLISRPLNFIISGPQTNPVTRSLDFSKTRVMLQGQATQELMAASGYSDGRPPYRYEPTFIRADLKPNSQSILPGYNSSSVLDQSFLKSHSKPGGSDYPDTYIEADSSDGRTLIFSQSGLEPTKTGHRLYDKGQEKKLSLKTLDDQTIRLETEDGIPVEIQRNQLPNKSHKNFKAKISEQDVDFFADYVDLRHDPKKSWPGGIWADGDRLIKFLPNNNKSSSWKFSLYLPVGYGQGTFKIRNISVQNKGNDFYIGPNKIATRQEDAIIMNLKLNFEAGKMSLTGPLHRGATDVMPSVITLSGSVFDGVPMNRELTLHRTDAKTYQKSLREAALKKTDFEDFFITSTTMELIGYKNLPANTFKLGDEINLKCDVIFKIIKK